ncbi:MAG: hypothetical protein SPF98_07255 [Campylobacter sp.]|nr:hypothetical protein [Campylobacter sp.]
MRRSEAQAHFKCSAKQDELKNSILTSIVCLVWLKLSSTSVGALSVRQTKCVDRFSRNKRIRRS